MDILLAQLTDLHIRAPGRLAYGRLDTAPYLTTAVRSLLALRQRPHAVVLTGDLTDSGTAQEYAHLAALLEPLPMPVYLLPGNHDSRAAMRQAFPGHAYLGAGEFLHYAVDVPGAASGGDQALRLIALDTLEPGRSAGALCPARLDWLAEELERSRHRPVIVAMHHPPFRTLIGHMDRIGLLEGAAALEALVARHPQVERIVCGHLHRTIYRRFGGTLVSTAPSPAHQVCLDLAEDAASAWTLEPPGFHLHAWVAGQGVVTHAAATGVHPGPYPFREPAVAPGG